MFHIYCSQELFQSSERVYNEINQISNIFPKSAFLQTQRALLHYHSKGLYIIMYKQTENDTDSIQSSTRLTLSLLNYSPIIHTA